MIHVFLLAYGIALLLTDTPMGRDLATLVRAGAARLFLPPTARQEQNQAKRFQLAACWPVRRWFYQLIVYFMQCRMCQCGQAAFWLSWLGGAPMLAALGLSIRCMCLAWLLEAALGALGLLRKCAGCGQQNVKATIHPPKPKKEA